MAALTKANALAEVRRRIDDKTGNVISDTQINEFLDRGARNVSVVTLCKPISETEALVQNKFSYALATDFIKIDAVTRTNTTGTTEVEGLQHIHPRHTGATFLGTPGTPKFWFDWRESGNANNVYIFPTPSAAVATGSTSVIVYGYEIVDDYGTTGTRLPKWANNLAVQYAVACCYIKEGKHAKAALEMQKYMNGLINARMILHDHPKEPDTIDMAKIPDTKVYPERQ